MPVKYFKLPELSTQEVNRFWNKVKIQPDGCWEWHRPISGRYPKFGICSEDVWKTYNINRVAYKIYYLQDPAELCVCHTCDNSKCANPFHLFLGTHQENMKDRNEKGRCVKHRTNPENWSRGENHPRCKLTVKKVLQIRELNRNGSSWGKLAKEFQVSKSTIQSICIRKNWKHI